MSNIRAASRYAKSLLELSNDQGVLEEVYKDMLAFRAVCESNYDFVLMLKNPIIKHDKKRAILQKIFEGKVNSLTLAIFDIITRKNREAILPQVATEFCNQYNILKNIGEASVTTAVPLSSELRKEMEQIVKKVSGMETVSLKEIINEDIIGGFVLKMGDKQIDDSVRTKLKTLGNQFSRDSFKREI